MGRRRQRLDKRGRRHQPIPHTLDSMGHSLDAPPWASSSSTSDHLSSSIIEAEIDLQATCHPSFKTTNCFSNGVINLVKTMLSYKSPLPSAVRAPEGNGAESSTNGTSLRRKSMGREGGSAVNIAIRTDFFNVHFFFLVFLATDGDSTREGEGHICALRAEPHAPQLLLFKCSPQYACEDGKNCGR